MSEQSQASGKKLSLLDLPPAILRRIFTEERVVTRRKLTLCKALLPYTLAGLYRVVLTNNEAQLRSFAAVTTSKPELLSEVEHFSPSLGNDVDDEQRNGMPGLPKLKKPKRSGMGRKDPQTSRRDSNWVLLQRLVRSMPNLKDFSCLGAAFLRHFFTPSFLDLNPFTNLEQLSVVLFQSDRLDNHDKAIYSLSRISPLRRLTFYFKGGQQQLPLPMLNAPSHVNAYLRPRSWDVGSFVLYALVWGGPELRHFFSLFSSSLTSVDLTLYDVSPSFANDILLLPPSLTKLILVVGYACPSGCEGGTHPAPSHALTDLASHFPHLTWLHLRGDIVSPATFLSLTALATLETIILGAHTQISSPEILDLLPPTLPRLSRLEISLCQGTTFPISPVQTLQPRFQVAHCSGDLPTVVWPSMFGPKDAEALLRKAEQTGVIVVGTMRCAVGMCGTDALHQRICIGDGV